MSEFRKSVRIYQWSCMRCEGRLVYASREPTSCPKCRDAGFEESSFECDGFAGFVSAHVDREGRAEAGP